MAHVSSPLSNTAHTRTQAIVDASDSGIESGKPNTRKGSWVSCWLSQWLSKSSNASGSDHTDQTFPVTDPYSIETRNLESSPGGYAKIALFQSSDRNFLQYRSFSTLHCRVLSSLQYEIQKLEMELDDLDEHDNDKAGLRKLCSKTFDERQSPADLAAGLYPENVARSRPDVLVELKAKLLEYDEFLLKTKEICSLQQPSKRDYESMRVWFSNESPIVQREARYIRRKEDIITLGKGREYAHFESFVERRLGSCDTFLQKRLGCRIVRDLFLTPELREKCKNDDVRYYSPARIDALVNTIITAVILLLLIMPVVILYELTDLGSNPSAFDAISVLIVFTLVFGMALSSLTKANKQELFGACAAYCGVLVVFIGNFGTQSVKIQGLVRATISN